MTSWSRPTTKDNTSRPDYGTSMGYGSARRSFQTSREGRSSSFPREDTTWRNGTSTRDSSTTRDYTPRRDYTTTGDGTSMRGGHTTTRDEESGLAPRPRPPKRTKSLTAIIMTVVSVLVVATVVWVVVFKTEDDSTQDDSTTPQVQTGLVIQSCADIEKLTRVLKDNDKATVDIDERNQDDHTCLMISAGSETAERLNATNLLISHGANLDLTWSPHHKTALHEAVWGSTRIGCAFGWGGAPSVHALLKAGANRDIEDYRGSTPAVFARDQKCEDLEELINNFKDAEIDECALNSVYKCNKHNKGGTCVDGLNSFSCDCSPGFSGSTCSPTTTDTTTDITTDIILMAAGGAVCLLMVGAGIYYVHYQQRKQAEERLRLERELENKAVFGTSRQTINESIIGSRGQSPSRVGVQHSRLSMSQMSKSQFLQPSRTYMSKSQASQPSTTYMSKSQLSQPTRSYTSNNQLSQPTTSFTVSNSQLAQQSDSRHY